ncbi:MAG TPA: DUF4175 family protein [Gemmatimonadales bacterium]|nr:DUF4175 family protein [Gemmatimonadales bacterium]
MSLLERLARSWRRRWVGVAVLAAGASGLCVAVASERWVHGWAATAGGAVALVVGVLLLRGRLHVDVRSIARHLDRTVPAAEESAELLIGPDAPLSPLERLQRERVERRLRQLDRPPRLPFRRMAIAGGYAIAVLLLTAGLSRGDGTAGTAVDPAGRPSVSRPFAPPRMVDSAIRLDPPAYTGRAARASGWDIDVEEGARIAWRVRTNRPVDAVSLVTGEGDTLRFGRRGTADYEAGTVAGRSHLYQLVLRDASATITSDYHRLTVIPDEPPTLTIVHPEPRTRIAPGEPLAVPLEVVAGDDYGVADARIVATVTAGSGEAVKFREVTLEFDSRAPQPGGRAVVLRRTLDLAALGMVPGDELYFSIEAHDRRMPRPNTGRSDTYFIALIDTAQVTVADLSGLAASGLPEYLRSQRQIITDTERLIADAARISVPVFRDRSNAIGIDQHALRERYGELAGDETVTQGTEPMLEHQHDVAENTTLLAQSVKDQLRAALAQMWDAELRLRTADPHGALPFEYRALELLKAAQQAARAYVQRTGFELPPLEPDRKRLTGILSGIGNATRQRRDTTVPSLPGVRAALTTVQRLLAGEATRPADVDDLERAGREIARLALEEPGRHLETLRDLRALIGSLEPDGTGPCRDCALRALRGLWQALPAPEPAAAALHGTGSVAQRYFELLRSDGRP